MFGSFFKASSRTDAFAAFDEKRGAHSTIGRFLVENFFYLLHGKFVTKKIKGLPKKLKN